MLETCWKHVGNIVYKHVDKRINGVPAQSLEKLSTVNRKDRKGPGNHFGSPINMKKVTKSRAAHADNQRVASKIGYNQIITVDFTLQGQGHVWPDRLSMNFSLS